MVARDGGLTNYGDLNKYLAEATGLPGFDLTTDQGRGDMGKLLGRVAIQDWAVNPDFMLTSLVKLTAESGPGQGFFKLAEQEDFFDPAKRDELDFCQEQVGMAHDRYRRGRRGRELVRSDHAQTAKPPCSDSGAASSYDL